MYNAAVKVMYKDDNKMLFRVFPDGIKINFVPGQYGALGLSSKIQRVDGVARQNEDDKLIKRAYSISSAILDDNDQLIDPSKTDYYEFYVDLVLADEDEKPRLSSRLFTLKDDDRLFLGPKIVGHYTLAPREKGKNVIFISTTTGEAPHNSMVGQLLNEGDCKIANIVVSEGDWVSGYHDKHQKLVELFSNYKFQSVANDKEYKEIETRIKEWLSDSKKSDNELGWAMTKDNTHVYLCGDPKMVGAPVKLGGWQYEFPKYGLMRIFKENEFTPVTRFQQGNLSHETYW